VDVPQRHGGRVSASAMVAVVWSDRLLAATQTALLKQAREEKRAAEEALREKRRELELVTASREQVGVELYNAQQQLQRIAQQLEAADQEHVGAVTERNAAEQGLSLLTRQHAELVQDAQSSRRAVCRRYLVKAALQLTHLVDLLISPPNRRRSCTRTWTKRCRHCVAQKRPLLRANPPLGCRHAQLNRLTS